MSTTSRPIDIPQATPGEHAVSTSKRLEHNIEALLARRRVEAAKKGLQDKVADRITRFAGSMRFVYLHLLVFGLWIAINTGLLPLLPAFDASLVILAMIASVEAIFISTFVLISQNRMAELDDKRADLNLQISLLAENETTQLLALVTAIAQKLDVAVPRPEEIEEALQDVSPEEVLDRIEERQKVEAERQA